MLYVTMEECDAEQNHLYKQYWSPMEQLFPHVADENIFDRFMRDYLTLKQSTIPNIDKVYSSFKTYHVNQGERPIAILVADIYRYATYYVNMALLWESDGEVKCILHDINTLKVDVAYPFLLEVYDDYAQKVLSRQDFIAILKLIESYVFRRAICGISTSALNKLFATLAKEIDKEHYLESVQVALLEKNTYRRFPGNDEFRSAFVVKDVYNFRLRNYLLRKLENAGQKELVNIESCTIEHIMPQNPNVSAAWQQELGSDWNAVHNLYLHTIGNLTLTGYNSELSDRPFQEKRMMTGGFEESPLRLNKSLKYVEHWNKDEIEKRAALLAEQAVAIWAIPHLEVVQSTNGNKPSQKVPLLEPQGSLIEVFEVLRKRILNLDATVREESRKYYIAYKAISNFVDIEPTKKKLQLTLCIPFNKIKDPKGLCRDVTNIGHHGNGDVAVSITSLDQMDEIMDLIRQSFEQQMEMV